MKKVNLTKALLVGASVAVLSTGATAGPNSQLKIADGASPKVQEQLTKSSDFQANAWTYSPKGTCESIVTPNGTGSLEG